MSDESYIRLREFLDQFPLGYPETDSGVEIKILKRLFTEEEARIAVLLKRRPEEVHQIAERTGWEEKELAEKLEAMSKKGLVFRFRRRGKTFYNSAPFMIGIYEYSVQKVDEELAGLYKEYYDAAYMDELGVSNIPYFKVIPIEKEIPANNTLLPYHHLIESIKAARKIAVTDCICRKESRLVGEGCDHPSETCLSFGIAAEHYIESGTGREISAEEAIAIIEETEKSGLVHASVNAEHLSNICNCCPCCCLSMKGITNKGLDKGKFLNALFEAIIDEEECISCEECLDRCPVNAITLEDVATVNRDKCLGCGLCSGVCPSEAITLHLREDREEPYESVFDMHDAIIEAKRKNA